MDDIVNVINKDPKVRIKINDMLDMYNRLPPKYQSKIGYDSFIQNFIFKELIKIMGTTITDLDIVVEMKNSRKKDLNSWKVRTHTLL